MRPSSPTPPTFGGQPVITARQAVPADFPSYPVAQQSGGQPGNKKKLLIAVWPSRRCC
ncbi:MAG: hypothetical protein ACRDQ7_10630 [Haloechinothrix sp.]